MDEYKPTAKGILHPVLKAASFSIALILIMFIAEYYNSQLSIEWVGGIVGFLKTYWAIISGFVLLVSVWDYLYPFYKDKNYAKYMKPLIDSVGITFGLWLVVEFIAALAYLIPDTNAVFLLTSFRDIFFQFFVWIFLLFMFINYARLFLEEKD